MDSLDKAAEKCLNSIQYDTLGADGLDRMVQTDEQTFKVIVPCLFDFAALNTNEVQSEFLFRNQVIQIETERADVLCQFMSGFFEGHKNTRLSELRRPANQKFHRQKRFAAPGTATNQRRATSRQSSFGDFVQSLDADRRFRVTTDSLVFGLRTSS
jgi:hypothetical protein